MAVEPTTDKCTCLSEINKALAEQRINTVVGDSLVLNRETGETRVVVEIAVYKRDSKLRKKANPILPIFCPFCGKRYQPVPEPEVSEAAS